MNQVPARWIIALRRSLSLSIGRQPRNIAALRAWPRGRSFTLIELLVVIAIIALLAALLLPVLHRAQMKNHQVVCLSNQRQINLAFLLFLDEASERLPDPNRAAIADWFDDELDDELGPRHKAWRCPSAPNSSLIDKPGTVRDAWSFHFGYHIYRGSYGQNLWFSEDGPRAFLSQSQIVQPTLTPVFADCVILGVEPRASDLPATNLFAPMLEGFWDNPDPSEMTKLTIPRHGNRPNPVPSYWPTSQPLPGAINVSFFDGHGELVKLDRLWQLYWHKDYQPPAKRPGLP